MDVAATEGQIIPQPGEQISQEKPAGRINSFVNKLKGLRNRSSKEALNEMAKNAPKAPEPVAAPELLPAEVQMESVEQVMDYVEKISLLDKCGNFLAGARDAAKDKAISLSPGIAAGVAAMAIGQLAGGVFNTEAANLMMTGVAGGIAGVDGSKLRNELKNSVSPKQIGKNAGLALIFMQGMQLSHLSLPDTLAAFADDAALPLLKLLPMLSMRSGGIK